MRWNLVRDQGLYLIQVFYNQPFEKLNLLKCVEFGGFYDYRIIYIDLVTILDPCLSVD